MFRNKFPRFDSISIRTRLLLLMLLLSTAILINLLALIYLARSVSSSQERADSVRTRQQLAVDMSQELRNAEAALYRYDLGGATGFADEFNFEVKTFGTNLDSYRSLASSDDERSWAGELDQIRQDVQTLGQALVRLHDRQAADLKLLISAQSQLSGLLAVQLNGAGAADRDYQTALEGVNDDAQALLLGVSAYLASPDETSHKQFAEAQLRLEQDSKALDRLLAAHAQTTDIGRIDNSLRQATNLGSQLISDRDEQQLSFTRFSSEIFQGEQEVIVGQIQPLEDRRLTEAQRDLQAATLSATVASLFVPIGLTLAAVLIAVRLARKMDKNILALLSGADRVAAGNLAQPVQVTTADELKRLAEAFNHMMTDLALRERGLKARLAELETLRAVSLQITSTLEPDQVLQTIATGVSGLVEGSSVAIFTRGENDETLTLAARYPEPEVEATAAGRTEGIVALAASTGRLRAVHADDSHSHLAAALPMRLGEQVLGVMHISSEAPRTFSSEDVRILNLLADQAAVALGNARLYRNLAEREERVRTLMEKMARVQDEERRLVGLDLHDGLTQLIISANMHLNALGSMVASTADPRARQELQETRALLKSAIDEARRVIAELRPTVVEEFGLGEGLRRYALEVSEAEGWSCETQIDFEGVQLTAPAEAAIFRIAQEALSNARKHSDTHTLNVTLQSRGGELLLCVRDWGHGFDPDALTDESQHLGLVGMQERAAMLGGACEIVSLPGQGTTVIVRVPLAALQRSAHEQQ